MMKASWFPHGVRIAGLAFCLAFGGTSWAADQAPAKPHDMAKMWETSLARQPLAVSATFDAGGKLWQASVKDGHVMVSRSDDRGKSFGAPVMVNPESEYAAADGENRPKILVAGNGNIYLSWTRSLETPYAGNIRFSRSLDGGRSFSAPVTVNDNLDSFTHRFEAMAMDTDGTPVIAWRQIDGKNVRDHATLRLDGKSQPLRASNDSWEVDACPHHGPALSIARDGVYHFVWFNNASERHGLFYANSADWGKNFSSPLSFGNFKAQAAHPNVLSFGKRVFIAWKEFDGTATSINLMHSGDGGKSWSAPEKVASTADTSDHPWLIADGEKAYLSWNTLAEGYRLIVLVDDAP